MKEQTFNEIIQEKNAERQKEYKEKAHTLVSDIVRNQEIIVNSQRKIIDLKKELNQLPEPEAIKVEL